MTDRELIAAFRRQVAEAATPKGYGYCGGQTEKVEHHVAHILPAVAKLLHMTEAELAAFARERNARAVADMHRMARAPL